MPINEYKNKGYMKTFKDLEFKPHTADKNGVVAAIEFDNGWGASVNEYRDWLLGELDKINTPIDLVGHDWGAGHVFGVLAARPNFVR